MRNFRYSLYIESPEGKEIILEGETDALKVRRIAVGRGMTKRLKGFRKAVITRDNKVLPGGRFALEDICYQGWLEDNSNE